MAEAPRKQALKPLLTACCWSIQETLRSLVGRKIEVTPGPITETTPDDLACSLRSAVAVVRGALDKDFAGKTLRFLCDAGEATTLAGAMMMTPDEVITERRNRGTLEGEELEAFAEVANVLCSGIDGVLRERLAGQAGLRVQDHSTLAPAAADASVLGDEPLIAIAMTITVEKFGPTNASLLIDRATAERWNGAPLNLGAAPATAAATGAAPAAAPTATAGEPDEDDGPAAPVRGRLAAYTLDTHTLGVLRKACRRVGLELDRRPRGDVPNPAAFKDALVFIEVSATEERRFDWCRRLKLFRAQTKVLLLLQVPSRQTVLQAARAGADVVLGYPVSAQLLMQKFTALLDAEAADATAKPPADAAPKAPAPAN